MPAEIDMPKAVSFIIFREINTSKELTILHIVV